MFRVSYTSLLHLSEQTCSCIVSLDLLRFELELYLIFELAGIEGEPVFCEALRSLDYRMHYLISLSFLQEVRGLYMVLMVGLPEFLGDARCNDFLMRGFESVSLR